MQDFDQIDADKLDKELLIQPQMVRHYGELHADAKHEQAQAEAQLDLAWAELWLEAKGSPSEFNLSDKPTVDDLKAAVTASERYQKAVRVVNQAKHETDVCAVAVKGVDHRKSMLGDIVQLFLRDYHSDDSPVKANNRPTDEQRKKAARKPLPSRG